MKSLTLNSPTLDSVKLLAILPDTPFTDAEYYSEKNNISHLFALYRKNNNEPDFDCEFLNGMSYKHNENTIDLEPEEDQTDQYNDDLWDAEIYDPYLESTYY